MSVSIVLIDTDHLGEAEEIISANFGAVQMVAHSSDTPTHTRLLRSMIGAMTVDNVSFGYDMRYQMEPPEQILLSRFRRGGLAAARPNRDAVRFGPGDVAAFGAHDGALLRGDVHKAHYDVLAIDRSLLDEVGTAPPGRSGRLRLTGEAALSAAATRQMTAAIHHVTTSVAANPVAAQSPLIAGAIQRYLASCMLVVFPSNAFFEPTVEDRHDSTPLLLRRAIAYIEDNVASDISLVDIAVAASVTPRALQYMFRNRRDCTPMEYVRRVRLHYAHLDLVAGYRTTTTVGTIASKWGFGNIGRFAVYHRETYGQSPHVTLRQ